MAGLPQGPGGLGRVAVMCPVVASVVVVVAVVVAGRRRSRRPDSTMTIVSADLASTDTIGDPLRAERQG